MCDCTVLLLYSPITCILKSMQQCMSLPVVLGGGGGPVPAVFVSKARKYSW